MLLLEADGWWFNIEQIAVLRPTVDPPGTDIYMSSGTILHVNTPLVELVRLLHNAASRA